jgi:hypothetical protein
MSRHHFKKMNYEFNKKNCGDYLDNPWTGGDLVFIENRFHGGIQKTGDRHKNPVGRFYYRLHSDRDGDGIVWILCVEGGI